MTRAESQYASFLSDFNTSGDALVVKARSRVSELQSKLDEALLEVTALRSARAEKAGLLFRDEEAIHQAHPGSQMGEVDRIGGIGSGMYRQINVMPAQGGIPASYYRCDSCAGWLLGAPEESPYDDMVALAGSAGVNYTCRLCGSQVGSCIHVVS